MGKNKKHRGPQKARAPNAAWDERTDVIDKAAMVNERMESYYKAQNIVPLEDWDRFLESLKAPLPTTFRVTGSRQTAHSLNDLIKNTYVPHLEEHEFEGEKLQPPSQIPWYPEGLAWQFHISKRALRKEPDFKKFHSFLVFETEVGNISRQEAVSMIPPLFLDVEPHHNVLDMCAAPGSKTAQLLEAMHAQDTATATSVPSGVLIANDSDYKRTHLLIHQASRLPSPAFMVTNLDASIYPSFTLPVETSGVSNAFSKFAGTRKHHNQLLFDRILCDVPCSGDGTLRKNPGIWKSWQPMDGNGLHGLQLRILQRAMRLLKEDGRIVYSTCSMNPVENEAVIAAALKNNPTFELVDVSSRLTELIRKPGMTAWTPATSRTVKLFGTYDEFLQSNPTEQEKSKIAATLWPPSNLQDFNLPRCLRIYPHFQDTGGFFVAVLRRRPAASSGTPVPRSNRESKRPASKGPDEGEPEVKKPRLQENVAAEDVPIVELSEATTADPEGSNAGPDPSQDPPEIKTGWGGAFNESPFTFIAPDHPSIITLKEKLHLTPDFPSHTIFVRNPDGETARVLYFANDLVKSIVQSNDYVRIRLMTAGTKLFTRQEGNKEGEPTFRVLNEGLSAVLPFVDPAQIMTGDLKSMKTMLEVYYPLIASFPPRFQADLEARSLGNHIVRFPAERWGEVSLPQDLVLPIWRSATSISLMVDKKAKSALSLRLFGEDITIAAREAKEKSAAVAAAIEPQSVDADMTAAEDEEREETMEA